MEKKCLKIIKNTLLIRCLNVNGISKIPSVIDNHSWRVTSRLKSQHIPFTACYVLYVFSDQLLNFWYLVHCHNCRYSTNVGYWILRRRCKHFYPHFSPSLITANFIYFQTYLLACCPDTWSTDLHERMYVYGLIVFAWLLPLTIITICYQKVRKIQKIHHETLYLFTSGTNT